MEQVNYWLDELMSNNQNTIRLYNGTNSNLQLVAIAPYVPSNLKFSIKNTWSSPDTSGVSGLVKSDSGILNTLSDVSGATAAALNTMADFARAGKQFTEGLGQIIPGISALSKVVGNTDVGKFIENNINSTFSSLTDEIYKFAGSRFNFNIPVLTCIYYSGFDYGTNQNLKPTQWIQKIVDVSAGLVESSDIFGNENIVRVIRAPNKFNYTLNNAATEAQLDGTLTLCIGGSNNKDNSTTDKAITINNLVVSDLEVIYSDEYVKDSEPLYAIANIQLQRVRATFPINNNLEVFGLRAPNAKVDNSDPQLTGDIAKPTGSNYV